MKSALSVFLLFITCVLLISLLAYPQLIYRTLSNTYQSNPSLLNFVKGTTQTLASLGGVFSPLHDALLSIAPSFREVFLSLGTIIKPLADLDPYEKYLVFQNVAAWAAALSALLYGVYVRKDYRHKKRIRHRKWRKLFWL